LGLMGEKGVELLQGLDKEVPEGEINAYHKNNRRKQNREGS